jgi:hypothetical protein
MLLILGEERKLRSSTFRNFLQPLLISSIAGPNILLKHLFSNILSLCSVLNVRNQGKITVSYILIVYCFTEPTKTKYYEQNGNKNSQNVIVLVKT